MTDIMTLSSPPDWQLLRLGQLFRERKEKGSDKDFPPLSVTMRGIVPQLETAAKTDDGDNRKVVRVGDYVINSRSDRKGSGGISDHEGSVSLISIVLQPRSIDPRFAHHLLRSPAFQEEFYRWGHGIVADLWTTRYADMKNIRLRVPDLSTQREIADFLDRETARIDLLIEKKQKLVALLGERKTNQLENLLFESGFELRKLRREAQIISKGTTPSTIGADMVDEGIRFLKAENVTWTGVSTSPKNFISGETHRMLRRSALRERDVLVVIAGTIGKTTVMPSELIPANTNQAVSFVRLRNADYAEIVSAAIGSSRIQRDILLTSVQSAQPNLSMEDLGNLMLPFPRTDEIGQVLDQIAAIGITTSNLIAASSASIDRLKEYRSALITAAVTGQIDVNTYAKSGTTDRRLDAIQEEMGA